jgi:hypothetical protein
VRRLLCALGVGAFAVVIGCVASPRAKTELVHRTDAVEFSGLFEVPGAELEIQAKNQRTQTWVRFATAISRAESPVLGATGSPYFRYSASAVLPQAPDYWLPHPAQRRIEAQVRVVHGERALTTFEADAESCARRAYARGVSERNAAEECASAQGAYARVFVAACGGLGEPCCPSAAADSCGAEFACEDSVCVKPAYAVPMLADYQVDLPLPAGFVLRDAWLVLDDRAYGPRSQRRLLADYRPENGVTREMPHPNVARLRFDLGFWKPGRNRFSVRGSATRGDELRTVESPMQQLDYGIPRWLGLAAGGRFQLPPEHFPRLMRDCRGPHCKDADADGQNDLWENVAAEQLRPRLLLDEDDGLFSRNSDAVRVLTSVLPIERGGESYVLFADVVAFSRDYGHLGLFKHPGDTEAFGMLFHVEDGDALTWVASAAKGHNCLTCSPRYDFRPQEFAVDGTPMLYVERNKHGLWTNGKDCRAHAAFSCGGQKYLRPEALNIGDPSVDGSRGLVDGLDGLSPNGPFAELAGVFPGDAVWSASRGRVPGRFCGGRGGCSVGRSANQPGNVISKLLALFEKKVLDVQTPARVRVQ